MTNMMQLTPPRFPRGPVDGQELERQFSVLYRDVFARLDVRYPDNDFKAGVIANTTGGVTLGSQAIPAGRAVGIPAITARINDTGRAQNQQFLWPVTVGNHSSVQSTSSILTSSSGPSTSTIAVAAHSVKYDFGSVAYNPGSVSGLVTGVGHLVYADDLNFAGGAVTYKATQEPNDMISTGRYYVGTIVTAVSATVESITAATSANPIAFTTATNHGWVSGDSVQFAGLPGDFGTNLNTLTKVITVTGVNTFTISVDGHLYTPYTSGGTATRVTPGGGGGGGSGAGGGGVGGRWQGFTP
jgi:Ubiquitin-activating enzyme E1 FCCH domain